MIVVMTLFYLCTARKQSLVALRRAYSFQSMDVLINFLKIGTPGRIVQRASASYGSQFMTFCVRLTDSSIPWRSSSVLRFPFPTLRFLLLGAGNKQRDESKISEEYFVRDAVKIVHTARCSQSLTEMRPNVTSDCRRADGRLFHTVGGGSVKRFAAHPEAAGVGILWILIRTVVSILFAGFLKTIYQLNGMYTFCDESLCWRPVSGLDRTRPYIGIGVLP